MSNVVVSIALTETPSRSKATAYVVVPDSGSYGDSTRVMSAHRTAQAARRAAARASGGLFRAVARISPRARGATWLRVYEETSPLA